MTSLRTAGTALGKPAPLTAEEIRLLVDGEGKSGGFDDPHLRRVELLEPDTQALFKDIADRGLLEFKPLTFLMKSMMLHIEKRDPAIEHNLFLVLRCLLSQSKISSSPGGIITGHFKEVMWGVYLPAGTNELKPVSKIATVEELEAVAALMYATFRLDDVMEQFIETLWTDWEEGLPGVMRLRNKYLVEYVLSHPEDVESIITYVQQRGLDPDDELLNGLPVAMEESHRSLGAGWL